MTLNLNSVHEPTDGNVFFLCILSGNFQHLLWININRYRFGTGTNFILFFSSHFLRKYSSFLLEIAGEQKMSSQIVFSSYFNASMNYANVCTFIAHCTLSTLCGYKIKNVEANPFPRKRTDIFFPLGNDQTI